MTDEQIDACPECDSAAVTMNAVGGHRGPGGESKGRMRCANCNAYFDEPARRAPRGHQNAVSSSQAALLNADPDDWPPGGEVSD